MKVALSFISGVIVCSLLLFGASTVLPTLASTDGESDASENLAQSLIDLLPDIEKIYQTAFTSPFIKAEEKIYDEDIAEYYHELIYKSLLSEPGEDTE